MTLTLLLTGFGPFPGAPRNPTATLVKQLAARRRRGVRGIAHVFATRYDAVDRELPELIARHRPDVLVMFGLAGRRTKLCIEVRARNRVSRWFPDAARFVPLRPDITPGAPLHRAGRAPFSRLVAAARASGAQAELSDDAGAYVCNYVYWRGLEQGPAITVFVHVPGAQRRIPKNRVRRRRMTTQAVLCAAEAVVAAAISAARLTLPR